MFYEFESSLRFELGGETWESDRPIQRFLQAFERAQTVALDLFGNSKCLFALISNYQTDSAIQSKFPFLTLCGIKAENLSFISRTPLNDADCTEEDNAGIFRIWNGAKLTDAEQVKELLWLSVASELSIEPKCREADIYLVDFDRQLALHVYDDRGMDVVATEKHVLQETYLKYHDWLLRFDLAKMDAAFL